MIKYLKEVYCRKCKPFGKLKLLFVLAIVTSIVELVNHIIFKIADTSKTASENGKFYKWHHGKISYTEAGRGKPLLLLHSIAPGSDLNEWKELIYVLARHYHVYAFDFLGFGHSDKPNIQYTAYLYVTLINDFIRDVIKSPTAVIASSLSADYAVMANVFNKKSFTEMILVSPLGAGMKLAFPTKKALLIRYLIDIPVFGTLIYNIITSRIAGRYFLQKICFYNSCNVSKEMMNNYYYSAHYKGESAKFSIGALFANQLNVDIKNGIKTLKMPVHIVWGSENNLSKVSTYNIVQNLCPNAELTVFENARTLPHVEYPKKFYKLCREFLKG